MRKLKTAVIGVGYLGKFHAMKYLSIPESNLIGVIDIDSEKAKKVGDELSVSSYNNIEQLSEIPDAVSIAVPTVYHYNIAKYCIKKGINILIEKPFASSEKEASELVNLSKKKQLCLQVGHLERFNPVYLKLKNFIKKPEFIESIRIAPFPKRGTDVDVILDLMIHDIDLVLDVVKLFPEKVEAKGISILTTKIDLANVRLKFSNGCVANLTASRVSDKSERKMRLFQRGSYFSLDFGNSIARKVILTKTDKVQENILNPEIINFEKGDPLKKQIESFLSSIIKGSKPIVSGKEGLDAIKVANMIKEKL